GPRTLVDPCATPAAWQCGTRRGQGHELASHGDADARRVRNRTRGSRETMTPRLTVGITTRDRPASLDTCLRSLDAIRSLCPEILVFDDGSHPPAIGGISQGIVAPRLLRDHRSPGYIVGRNRLVREAAAPAVLLLDDDTRIVSRESIEQALAVLNGDGRVAAVAFSQAEADGRPWPVRMQPSPVTRPSIVASFIGFAHLLRRDVFLALGGYREDFVYFGEEKDFCVRLL